jgi:hypothetical protein
MKTDDFRCVPLSMEKHRHVDGPKSAVTDEERLQLALALVDCLVAWIEVGTP